MTKTAFPAVLTLCAIGLLAIPGPVGSLPAQEGSADTETAADLIPSPTRDDVPARFQIVVTEYRLDSPPAPTATAAEILERLKSGDGAAVTDSVRLTASVRQKAQAQFGRTAYVVTGRTFAGRGEPVKSFSATHFGTMVEATVMPQRGAYEVALNYEVSRPERPADAAGAEDETPPGMQTFNVQTALPVQLGRPALIAGHSGDAVALTLTVTQNDPAN
ncbi:hypothetical protein [Alienimonas chondri]|uniref:Uncharacterized protein n=1 Tax=Alienimonas chondri TaxID=2681879 RepID=A0ABX1VDG4_9PLAN|nr:hypothetical protein [Alienimonas chondri]NNJ25277.1 hypothetical protein [Alienimonas chondri]